MPQSSQASRFLFNASTVAVAGRLVRPFRETIPVQAAAALPTIGGTGSSRIEGFRYRDIVRFDAAYTTVEGNVADTEAGRIFNTLATVTIEGLNVMDVVTADRVVARLVSEQQPGGADPLIRATGSHFENLRVAGKVIELASRKAVSDAGTVANMASADEAGVPVLTDLEGAQIRLPAWERTPRGPFTDALYLTSLYEVPASVALSETPGGRGFIHVPGFGRVYLGEYLVKRFSRRLTMIRLQLGSPVEGEIEFGSDEVNGHTYP